MRIKGWIPAIAAGLMVIFGGSLATTAASSPASARPAAPAHVGVHQAAGSIPRANTLAATDSFDICNYVGDYCIEGAGSGKEVNTLPGLGDEFEWYNDDLELRDIITGLCLKDDPSEGNAVVELACTESGNTALEEEWGSNGGGWAYNVYAADHDLTSGTYLHMRVSSPYTVNCYELLDGDGQGDYWPGLPGNPLG